MHAVEIVERKPTVPEFAHLTTAVGWRPRDVGAITAALEGSLYAVCAEVDRIVVGMGRVIGDGGLHYYLTDVAVHPAHQRRGVGSKIVEALTRFVERVPFKNTWIGVFAVEGTVAFYARYGYKAQAPTGPAMYRWLNRSDA
jgi:GNAT superfamily N-acetyltransferase